VHLLIIFSLPELESLAEEISKYFEFENQE
jgi:hypothetical protein